MNLSDIVKKCSHLIIADFFVRQYILIKSMVSKVSGNNSDINLCMQDVVSSKQIMASQYLAYKQNDFILDFKKMIRIFYQFVVCCKNHVRFILKPILDFISFFLLFLKLIIISLKMFFYGHRYQERNKIFYRKENNCRKQPFLSSINDAGYRFHPNFMFRTYYQ